MPLFTTTNYPINALIEDIDLGKIGLPELQRPFVWPNVNVRNLFDSLYRGYPAGFLLFWKTGAEGAALKGIGAGNEKAVPETAIVDGQQRRHLRFSHPKEHYEAGGCRVLLHGCADSSLHNFARNAV
jgi:uncharacterized protein with ParB-like and HNH nuclease domain